MGQVLFAHALLVHSGGINEGSDVRLAVINDFQRVRPKTTLMWQVEDARTPHTHAHAVWELLFGRRDVAADHILVWW